MSWSVSDQSQIEDLTHDALVHLYDIRYLQRHPLARWLIPASSSELPGRVLRRLLLEAIQELKPPPDAPSDTVATARYQFLYLRYIRGESIQRIASELSLSERQVYRRQRDALETVASILFRKRPSPSAESGPTEAALPVSSDDAVGSAAPEEDTQTEVDRIGMAQPGGETDLLEVLRSALSLVSNLTRAGAQTISLDVRPGVPSVVVNRVVLRQAILGILVFANDLHGDETQIAVRSSASEVQLTIRIYCRIEPDTPRRVEADSNLGVSKRLIALQGGRVAWRIDDECLEIVIGLPVDRQRTVLVVDDNHDTLHLFNRFLEGRVHRILTASTGEEALRVVAQARPDAVILDVMLPSADGWEVLQSLRSHPDTADVPVIVCTVLKQRDLALSLGATDFVAKPVTQGTLLEALSRSWSGTH